MNNINISRSIGIILVVFGHTIVPEMRQNSEIAKGVFDIIYSFHMPLFIMLSGFLYEVNLSRYKSMGKVTFLKKKFHSLMLPYFSFSIINYVGLNAAFLIPLFSNILFKAGYEPSNFLSAIFEICTYQNHLDKHIWFIYTLFIIFVITFLLNDFMKSKLGLVIQLALFITNIFIPLPTIIHSVFGMLIFFNLARFTNIMEKYMKKEKIVGFTIMFILLYMVGQYYNDILFLQALIKIPLALSGAMAILCLSSFIQKYNFKKGFHVLDKYSYDIYLIHQPFIVSGVVGILLTTTSLHYPIICMFTFILGVGLPILFSKFFIRKLKWLSFVLLGK